VAVDGGACTRGRSAALAWSHPAGGAVAEAGVVGFVLVLASVEQRCRARLVGETAPWPVGGGAALRRLFPDVGARSGGGRLRLGEAAWLGCPIPSWSISRWPVLACWQQSSTTGTAVGGAAPTTLLRCSSDYGFAAAYQSRVHGHWPRFAWSVWCGHDVSFSWWGLAVTLVATTRLLPILEFDGW
jgi:hypothetical protein